MKKLYLILALGLIAGSVHAEDFPILSFGGGGFLPLDDDREVVWEDPPNLEGLIGSSEQILEIGLESELANDFILEVGSTIRTHTWWGGYCCEPGDPLLTSFNLRMYDDSDCVPLNLIAELIEPSNANETFIYVQDETGWPVYEYHLCWDISLEPGLYWFGAQGGDHPIGPQWGRLAAEFVQACDTVFKSEYLSFPDWLPAIDVFGVPYDASQRFDDECDPTPTVETSWGVIKGLYR